MKSAESSSPSWDFTTVISLLHTPIYPVKISSSPDRRRDSPGDPSSPDGSGLNDTEKPISGDERRYVAAKPPRLGDFGSLWDLLKQSPLPPPPPPPPESPSAVEKEQENVAANASKASSCPNPMNAPQAPSNSLTNKTIGTAAHQKPTKNFTILKRPNTPASRRADAIKDVGHGGLSETASDTSVQSDGDLSVFDLPASQKQGALSSIPCQTSKATSAVDPLLSPPSSCDEMESFVSDNRREKTDSILANTPACRPAAEKRADLIKKLLKDFPDRTGIISRDRGSVRVRYPPDSSSQIHVFVDASNIMIGFHDSFKSSRNIPITTKARRLSLSFHNLSIILERGRKATKRVLVGSDRFPAIKEAERIGYETNILDRVQKDKQRTSRRSKFRGANSNGAHGSSSGSDAHPREERWVEQGVDEILQLKILESLVDTEAPATIVLATGDAAKAEYSGGFLKMVERALQKGWAVEVVSFSMNTSSAYKKKGFHSKWRSQFKMICLDDYIEELLDT